MERPTRKQLRLQGYDYSRKGAYFITICAQDRTQSFDVVVGAALCGRPNPCGPNDGQPGETDAQSIPTQIIQKWLFELENKYSYVTIDYYVIMPDHVHFILFLDEEADENKREAVQRRPGVPEMVDWFKTMTTNEYIRHVKNGTLPPFQKRFWQRSYYEHIIRNEEELSDIRKYILENPQKLSAFHSSATM